MNYNSGLLVSIRVQLENKTTRRFEQEMFNIKNYGNFLVVQWLSLHTANAECASSIPGQGTKIPRAVHHSQKI